MSIDEAIIHAREVAEKNRKDYKNCPANRKDIEHQTCEECAKEHEELAEWLEELKQYRSIGTVEECREAIEKQKEKKPKHSGCYDNDGVWHEWNGINGKPYELCPNCGTNLCCEMPYDKKPKYCNECGQKLDRS